LNGDIAVTLGDPNPSNQPKFYILRCLSYLCSG